MGKELTESTEGDVKNSRLMHGIACAYEGTIIIPATSVLLALTGQEGTKIAENVVFSITVKEIPRIEQPTQGLTDGR